MVRRTRPNAGMTLIELMVTISIMGVAFAAILAGLSGMFRSDDQGRRLAVIETYLRRYADDVQSAPYVACATASAYQSSYSASLPSGYGATLSVAYWDGNAPNAGFGASCSSDKGVQQVTVTVAATSTSGAVSQSVVVVKRDPS